MAYLSANAGAASYGADGTPIRPRFQRPPHHNPTQRSGIWVRVLSRLDAS